MYIFHYLYLAYLLVKYLCVPSYRHLTNERWRRTPPHHVISEVGYGIIGLVVAVTIALMIIGAIVRH